jgi:hypothetical protein
VAGGASALSGIGFVLAWLAAGAAKRKETNRRIRSPASGACRFGGGKGNKSGKELEMDETAPEDETPSADGAP